MNGYKDDIGCFYLNAFKDKMHFKVYQCLPLHNNQTTALLCNASKLHFWKCRKYGQCSNSKMHSMTHSSKNVRKLIKVLTQAKCTSECWAIFWSELWFIHILFFLGPLINQNPNLWRGIIVMKILSTVEILCFPACLTPKMLKKGWYFYSLSISIQIQPSSMKNNTLQ